MTKEKTIRIKQVKSLAGSRAIHRLSVKGLGLKKINHEVVLKSTPENLGMIKKCRHLIKILEENEIK
tara:strand:+ start:4364 stop:4564 length:201 start_codon:yes stop_codon:yes gene_type:complete